MGGCYTEYHCKAKKFLTSLNFQVVSPFSKHGDIYTVDAEACNAGIPYADSFFVSNHWCLTRESATETRLSVWSQVKYKKNVWGFMKGNVVYFVLHFSSGSMTEHCTSSLQCQWYSLVSVSDAL